MRLNGWQRIGCVISALWAVGSAIYVRSSQVQSADVLLEEKFKTCMSKQGSIIQECFDRFTPQNALDVTTNWYDVLFISLTPIIVGWLLAYLALKAFTWVKAGF